MYLCKFGKNPPLFQKIEEEVNFYRLYMMVTLKSRSFNVTKMVSTLYCVTMVQYTNLGQNPSLSSRDNTRKSYSGQNLIFQSDGVTL